MPAQLMTMMAPVLALIVWTLVMWVWLYVRRLPAMRKAGIDPARIKGSESYASLPALDPKAVWVSDNFTHLHEQPTIFYALCVYSHVMGVIDDFNVWLAWLYVALRIVHSLVQVISNYVPLRFMIFMTGSVVLTIITLRNVLALFGI